MKVLFFITICLAVLATTQALRIKTPQCTRAEFEEYKIQFNKVYANAEEDEMRFNFFCDNKVHIAQLNAEENGATFAINKFSDMDRTDFNRVYTLGRSYSPEYIARTCLANGVTLNARPSSVKVPQSFDWRDKNVVNPVKDQGQCGSCWAFSTVAELESITAIKTGVLRSLSEQQVVDCSHSCAPEPPFGNVCNQGCNGGWPWSAYTDILHWGGLATEANYPYKGVTGVCKQPSEVVSPIKNYTCLSHPNLADEDQMVTHLYENGPLSIALNAAYLQSYYGGILKPTNCNVKQLNHAVTVVGYGVEGTTKYWIVRNSWGENWGEKGYFRIIRGSGACGINAAVSSVVV